YGFERGGIVRLFGDLADAPTFLLEPTDQTARVGQTVALSLAGRYPTDTTIQWHHLDLALPGATAPILEFPNVVAAQAGTYYAVLSNAFGVVTSRVATVTVNPAQTGIDATDLAF